jgi:putative Mn2+ efflux pump MntP
VGKLVLFVLPLGLDTFAVAAALGMRGLRRRERLRVGGLLAAFEMTMPLVGLLVGHAIGGAVGEAADWVAVAILALLAGWMLLHEDDSEREKAGELATRGGLAVLALGLSISLDELAIGFTIGLLHLSLWLAIPVIGGQAFLLSQLGLLLGSRIDERLRGGAGRLAGVALLGLATLLLVEQVG